MEAPGQGGEGEVQGGAVADQEAGRLEPSQCWWPRLGTGEKGSQERVQEVMARVSPQLLGLLTVESDRQTGSGDQQQQESLETHGSLLSLISGMFGCKALKEAEAVSNVWNGENCVLLE